MIEEPALLNWTRFRQTPFQYPNPAPELKIIGTTYKKVQMIGHDYISTDRDAVLLISSGSEFAEGCIYGIRR
jgi:hypothetical protein